MNNLIDYNNPEAMQKAIENGHTKIVELLLNHDKTETCHVPPEPFERYKFYDWLLWLAVGNGNKNIVELLVEDGRANILAFKDLSLIFMVAEKGHFDIVKFLLDYTKKEKFDQRALKEELDFLLLMAAAGRMSGHESKRAFELFPRGVEFIKILLEDGRADPSKGNSRLFSIIAKRHLFEVVELLLKDGRADPSVDNSIILREAHSCSEEKIVKLLLDDGRAKL